MMTVRPMVRGDLESVMLIERSSFSHPWSRSQFLSELRRGPFSKCFVGQIIGSGHASDSAAGHDSGDAIPGESMTAGFIMAWLVADELHITNLAVAPGHRRSGIAARLLEHVMEDGIKDGASWCQLEVRVSNVAARSLYRGFGFEEVGLRKRYYQNGEDALLMAREL